jgi:hypothetical protein
LRSSDASTGLGAASRRGLEICLAWTSLRALRSVSACALPRPSAIASAKFAKRTVNQSQSETARMKPAAPRRADERLHEEPRREDAPDLDDEHDGVAHLVARVELAERVDDGAPDDGAVEERARLARARGCITGACGWGP